jgi:CHAT domain-containing protein
LVAFWAGAGGAASGWLEGPHVDLGRIVGAVRPWLERSRGDVEELLDAAGPLAADLHAAFAKHDFTEVVVMPVGPLYAVPFGAIPLDGGTLDQIYTISYAPSVAILRRVAERAASRSDRIELIAAHGRTLPWANAEIKVAAAVHQDAAVTPDGAAKAEILSALGRARLAHLAAHGQWWADDHFASRFNFRHPDPGQSSLSLAEVHRDLDLRDAELVMLSACDTGRSPRVRKTVELYSGLDGAFLAQGARSVVSTMWPVDDFAAFVFMTNLHVRLLAGDALAEAFAHSVRLLRDGGLDGLAAGDPLARALDAGGQPWRERADQRAADLRQPRYWAPFRLSGAHWLAEPLA